MVLIVKMMGLLRVKMGVRKTETARLVLLQVGVGDVAVGLLRKPVDFDVILRSGKLLDHTDLLAAMALLPGHRQRCEGTEGDTGLKSNTTDSPVNPALPCVTRSQDFLLSSGS